MHNIKVCRYLVFQHSVLLNVYLTRHKLYIGNKYKFFFLQRIIILIYSKYVFRIKYHIGIITSLLVFPVAEEVFLIHIFS